MPDPVLSPFCPDPVLSRSVLVPVLSPVFKDPLVTAAAIDRLVHHGLIIELNLASYRMAAAQQARHSRAPDQQTSTAAAHPDNEASQ